MTFRQAIVIAMLALCGSLYGSIGQAQTIADLVVVNAKVFGPESYAAGGIAVREGRILAVGKNDDMQKYVGSHTVQIDAKGCTVSPGFCDAHVHFLSGSLSLQQVNLLDAETLPAIQERIRKFAESNPQLNCVMGRGWLYGAFPDGLPTRQQLDAIIRDRPVVMRCYDGHTVWVNSKTLAMAGIDSKTADPENGIIVRDSVTGEPTGVLKEAAQSLIDHVIPKPTRQEKLEAIRQGITEAHRFGVTSIHEAGMAEMDIELFHALSQENELPLRVSIALDGKSRMTEEDADQLELIHRRFAVCGPKCIKLYVDGVVEAHTAAVLQPYENKSTLGLPEFEAEDLKRVVTMLDRRGWQVMIHAIGDAGIRMCLDAFEHAAEQNGKAPRTCRFRVEHVEAISREDIERFGKLGVIASMQPYHASPNGNIFNVWAANLGPERASRAWVWKSIQDAHGHVAFGTDWPVVGLDPLPGIHTALTRQTPDGQPAMGFLPEQRMPLRDVLQAYTIGSAYAQRAEDKLGSIELGKLADLIIWDRDLFALPIDQVQHAKVSHTIVNGEVVYSPSDETRTSK